jgi:hypothetical protein
LTVLKAAWNKPLEIVDGNSTTVGTSPNPPLAVDWICADFDHAHEGKGLVRVAVEDLTILKANWNVNNGPDPNCGL